MTGIGQLKTCILFSTLTDKEFEDLIESAEVTYRTLQKHETLFSPHDPSDHIGIILGGGVEVHQHQLSGIDIILDTKGPYDLIAGPSVYSSHTQYANTIIATKKSDVLLIKKDEWNRLIYFQPKLLEAFLQFLSNQVVFMSFRLSLISQPTLKKKLVRYLLHQYHSTNSDIIILPFSKKKLSEYLNAQPQSLSRTFKELVTDGYISMEKNTVHLLCPHQLSTLLH